MLRGLARPPRCDPRRERRTAEVEAALSASHASKSALAARYRRVMRHRGHQKAVIAVAHAMLVSAYHVLAHQVAYRSRP